MTPPDDQVRVRLTAGGQITIPATLRYALGLYPGDVVVLTRRGEVMELRVERQTKKKEPVKLTVLEGGR